MSRLLIVSVLLVCGCSKALGPDWKEESRKANAKLEQAMKEFHEDCEGLRQSMQKLSEARAKLLFPECFPKEASHEPQ